MSCFARITSLLALSLVCVAPVLGQRTTPRFAHITLADGLPESGIYEITQDRLGFIWLGTQNGLIRYDGFEFESFKPDALDTTSLSGRLVMSLLEDREGILWVGTRSGGLNRFDPATGAFERFRQRPADPKSLVSDAVGAIFEDRQGRLWIGSGVSEKEETQGVFLSRLDRLSGSFEHFRIDQGENGTTVGNGVSEILEDSSASLWIATRSSGLHRFDPSTGEFEVFRHSEAQQSLAHDSIYAMAMDGDGSLWLGTWGGGLDHFLPSTRSFEHYRHVEGDRTTLADDRVMSIYSCADGALWVGTRDNVLHRFDPANNSFERLVHDAADPRSLNDGYGSWAIFEDRTGTLWVSQGGVGIDLLDPFASKFLHYRHDQKNGEGVGDGVVQTLLVDRQSDLWVGTSKGLTRVDPTTGRGSRIALPPGEEDDPTVISLLQDRQGGIWVGTAYGLRQFDSESGALRPYLPQEPKLPAGSIESLLEDRQGNIWVGVGDKGLHRIERDSGRITSYAPGTDSGQLSDGYVRALLEDRSGSIWVGTVGGGLNRLEPKEGRFEVLTSSLTGLEVVFALHEDRAGRIWAGTQNGGLHLIDPEVGTRQRLTEKDGLAHDTVYAISEDRSGRLWISTGRGLSSYDPETRVFRTYDTSDGLLEPRLSGGSAASSRGMLYLGSPRGVQAFLPDSLEDDPHPPPVVLTGLRIFNEKVEDFGGSILDSPISVAESVRLSPEHKVFSLEFAALHFAHPGLNRYAFRLDPFDEDWNEVGSQRRATYTNLAPGEYLFRVKAANSDGVWNEEGASIRIVMDPPWWRTRWAVVLFSVAILASLVLIANLQRRRVQRRERELSERREARLRTEAAEAHARAAETEARVIRVENERKTRELEAARELQLSMLPEDVPDHPNLEIAATMLTATEVGGDYYDFDVFSDGTLMAVLGDAAGHGLRAGMMVMSAKSLFASIAGTPDLASVLERGNRVLKRMRLRRLNMALALVRIRGDRLEAASAGIPPLLLYRAGDGAVWEIGQGGVPLGSLAEQSYQQSSHEFMPGDVALLMSDGFPELRNPAGEPLGYDRARQTFRNLRQMSPSEIVRELVETADKWSDGRPRDDDMTFVVIRKS